MKKFVGVISDTHGLFRPEVCEVFAGVDLILHAGDIGAAEVIQQLRAIAPVIAIRGNNDTERWARAIPETTTAKVDRARIYILHNVKELDIDPAEKRFNAVISGHSHKPLIEARNGVLFLNPGSAGPRRFKLPISVARLTVDGAAVKGEIINL